MSKKYYIAFSLIFLLILAGNSFAVSWTDGGSGHLWSTGSNWSDNDAPLFGENVYINNGYTGPVIDSTVTALSGIIRMGGTGTRKRKYRNK